VNDTGTAGETNRRERSAAELRTRFQCYLRHSNSYWEVIMTHDPNDVVRVYAGSALTVQVYRAALAEAGIACRVVGTELSGSFGSVLPAAVELWVHRIDGPTAEAVIARESRPADKKDRDRPRQHFSHPTDDPKPAPPPHRREPYVNPDPGA
jgi:hypothetical protein